jgi:hypothetical protein
LDPDWRISRRHSDGLLLVALELVSDRTDKLGRFGVGVFGKEVKNGGRKERGHDVAVAEKLRLCGHKYNRTKRYFQFFIKVVSEQLW